MKIKVKLHFPDLEKLWDFVGLIPAKNIQISRRTCILTALCTEQELQQAITVFGATLVSNEQTADPSAL